MKLAMRLFRAIKMRLDLINVMRPDIIKRRHLFLTFSGLLNHFKIAVEHEEKKEAREEQEALWLHLREGLFYFEDCSREKAFDSSRFLPSIKKMFREISGGDVRGAEIYRKLLDEITRAETEGRVLWKPEGGRCGWYALQNFLAHHGYPSSLGDDFPEEDYGVYEVGDWVGRKRIPLVVHWSLDQWDRAGIPGSMTI